MAAGKALKKMISTLDADANITTYYQDKGRHSSPKAYSALTPSGNTTFAEHWKKLGCLLIAVVAILYIGLLRQSATLTCTRVEEGTPVSCVRQKRTLWVIPLGSKEITHVKAARLSARVYAEDCSPCNRVELITFQGIIPLTYGYSSSSNDKIELVNKVNDFVKSGQSGSIVVAEPEEMSMFDFVCSTVWLLIILIWKSIKE